MASTPKTDGARRPWRKRVADFREFTIGEQHPDRSWFWLHTETAWTKHGWRYWLRFGHLTTHFEWEAVSLREWGVYFSIYRRGFDWLRINLGPGVIPF